MHIQYVYVYVMISVCVQLAHSSWYLISSDNCVCTNLSQIYWNGWIKSESLLEAVADEGNVL